MIKGEAELKGYDRRKLSDLTGYEENYLSTLINGSTNFPYSFLVSISEALELDLQNLIKLKNEKH